MQRPVTDDRTPASRRRARRGLMAATSATTLALALIAAPVAPSFEHGLRDVPANAKAGGGAGGPGGGPGGPGASGAAGGPGNGNGPGGNGNGPGGPDTAGAPGNSGNAPGHGASGDASGPGNAPDHAASVSGVPGLASTAPGKSGTTPGLSVGRSHRSGPSANAAAHAAHAGVTGVDVGRTTDRNAGLTAASLGSLNAAHAAAPALANASRNSVVGQIGDYAAEVSDEDGTAVEAAAALNAAARNRGIDEATVEAVNGLVGISDPTVSPAEVAAAANAEEGE